MVHLHTKFHTTSSELLNRKLNINFSHIHVPFKMCLNKSCITLEYLQNIHYWAKFRDPALESQFYSRPTDSHNH
jgi:hypothetical protein